MHIKINKANEVPRSCTAAVDSLEREHLLAAIEKEIKAMEQLGVWEKVVHTGKSLWALCGYFERKKMQLEM